MELKDKYGAKSGNLWEMMKSSKSLWKKMCSMKNYVWVSHWFGTPKILSVFMNFKKSHFMCVCAYYLIVYYISGELTGKVMVDASSNRIYIHDITSLKQLPSFCKEILLKEDT